MKFTKKISNGLKTRIYNTVYSWDKIQSTLITSTGRTGTMFFSKFFTENFQQTKAVHEPWPDLHDIGYNFHHSHYSREKTVDIIKRERSVICKELNQKGINFYLESNYNLSYLLPFLDEVFGQFKLVHLIREPKSQLKSIFSVKEAKRHIYADFDNRPRISAVDFDDDPFRKEWKNWGRFEKLCWHYYKVNTLIGDFVERNPERAITVKFSEIFAPENNYDGLFTIANFVGFPLKDGLSKEDLIKSLGERANKTKSAGIDTYETWSDSQKQVFHKVTDPIAKRFGFIN